MKGLLVHAGAIGDFVLSLRIVEAMRLAGAADVTVLGRPEIASIAVGGGGVDAVLDLNQGGYHSLFAPDAPLPAAVKEALRRMRLAVDMLGGPGSVFSRRLGELGIDRVVGIDPRPRSGWIGHISDQWLCDLAKAGLKALPGPPRIRVPAARRGEVRAGVLKGRIRPDKPLAVLHPGSGSRQKCWPLDDFVSLADSLGVSGWSAVFLLGPVEAERFSAAEITSLRGASPLFCDCALAEAAALLAVADLYIGNDSGMSHLAAAVGTRTIAIFGPTEACLWGPLGKHVLCVTSPGSDAWPSRGAVLEAVGRIMSGRRT